MAVIYSKIAGEESIVMFVWRDRICCRRFDAIFNITEGNSVEGILECLGEED